MSMRAVVERTLRERFAAVLLAAASVPLVIALGMLVLPAFGGGPAPPSQHLSGVPPLTTSPPPVAEMTTSTALPDPSPTPTPDTTPTPASTASPATDPFTGLCLQTQAASRNARVAGGLCQHLVEAQQHYSASDLHAEGDAVRAYMHGVHDARGKSIDPAAADSLIAGAQALPGMPSQPAN